MDYTALLERDLESIPAALSELHGDELFLTVTRFAVLAYAPSQHSKHALLACLAAHDLRDELGERFDELMIECARYAAEARQPWSEPPILDPPAIDDDQRGDVDELRAAIADLDRLRGERWLARRINDADDDLLAVAAEDGADLGHKLIVTRAALRLADLLGEKGRYAMLRVAIVELTAYPHEPFVEQPLDVIVANILKERASIESAHALFRFHALCRTGSPAGPVMNDIPIYRLARDYAECLKMHAVVKRLRPQYPQHDWDAVLAAAKENMENADFAEWSFA